MADPLTPNDGYVAYYTEKIWNLIPSEYRRVDFLADNAGVLRAFVEVLATQAAVLRRSSDRLWDDFFVDLCDDWAVPYLGDLVGTRLISALNRRGRRVDVAKTIYYRRRKGTLRVLEELIGDITGWDGTVRESFRGLRRTRHGLDPVPGPLAGRYSKTPPGGWADLRKPFAATLADGPFDEYAHTPDVRRQHGLQGRWNIPKIVFHLFRLTSYRVTAATPAARADGVTFLFDPSGRDIPLFAPRRRIDDYDTWRMPLPWELPAPIRCRLLGDSDARNALVPAAIGVDLGGGVPEPAATTGAANLGDFTATAAGKTLLVDPERGRFKVLGAAPAGPVSVDYHYGFSADIGAGPFDRRRAIVDLATLPNAVFTAGGGAITAASLPLDGGLQIEDSGTYGPVANRSGVHRLVVQAADRERPYLRLDADWRLTASGGAADDDTLVLSGLWIGSGADRRVEIAGSWERVTLRHVTLDPGGTDADGNALGVVQVVVLGVVEELIIESSIVGPIAVAAGGVVVSLVVRDTIVQSRSAGQAAIASATGRVRLERVTVQGDVSVERLIATETLVIGTVDVADTQDGCFRFSAAGAGSRLPQPFESHVLGDTHAILVSTTFGDPQYAELSEVAPSYLRRGAENGSEIGAFSALNAPIKLDGLRAKVEEFLPFGLIPLFDN
ncbi:MAG TPA: hypothetical protein VFZ36_12305 [Vicinamibacterales bacterium]